MAFFLRGKRFRKVRHVIMVCSLWLMRNKVIFQGCLMDFTFVLDQIKTISWGWFIFKEGMNSGLIFSDWCTNPVGCLGVVK